MARGVQNFPVELHSRILDFAIATAQQDERSLRRPRPGGGSFVPFFDPFLDTPVSEDTPAVQEKLRSPSLFPFNAAYVCKLWRDILSRTPECWKRVVFDLARDPSPIVDAFEWSKAIDFRTLHVLVFNSLDPEDVDAAQERNRVQAIVRALKGHTDRCESIIFDTIYSSALPHPGIFFLQDARALTDLTLTCRVDDMDENAIANVVENLFYDRSLAMNSLAKVSLTGFCFMALLSGLENYGLPYTEQNLDIHITKFAFPQQGPYSLATFAKCLERASSYSPHFYFHDLSLSQNCSPSDAEPPERRPKLEGYFNFIRVSYDCLQQLFTVADFYPDSVIVFEDCLLPEHLPTSDYCQLELRKFAEDAKGTAEFMRRALLAWPGRSIAFDDCPAFNDDFLRWWAREHDIEIGPSSAPSSHDPPRTERDQPRHSAAQKSVVQSASTKAFPLSRADYLYVHDCPDFSPSVLRESLISRWEIAKHRNLAAGLPEVEARKDESDAGKRTNAINDLTVVGNVPALTEEDAEWFKQNEPKLKVTWCVGESEYGAFEVGRPPPRYYNPYKPWDSDSD